MQNLPFLSRTLPALAAVLLLAPASWRDARAADTQKLLFTSKRTGNLELFLANADGSDAKNLTNNPAEDAGGCWSPDGKQIVFASSRSGSGDIYVMDADGSHVRQLTTDPARERDPAWSPDGKKIAFVRHLTEPNPEIILMDADGSNQVNLTNSDAYDADPFWSPDSKKLFFVRGSGQGYHIYAVEPGGGESQMLPGIENLPGWVFPAWSPDGKKIAFTGEANGELEIFTCDPDGGNRKQLTSLKGRNTHAAWSPDGKELAFQHYEEVGDTGALYVMEAADGNNLRQVCPLEGSLDDGRPAWRPK
jgi:Tol biopolymer transport system component